MVAAGGEAGGAYLMLGGEAQALAYTAAGHMVLLGRYLPGDLFGDMAGPAESEHDLVALLPSEAGQFTSATFVALVEMHGCIAIALAKQLTARLSAATRRMVEVATVSTTGRIHAELLRLAGDARVIRPAPVLSQLAIALQTTRETVSRTISALEKRGIVRREDGALFIVAPHRLEELLE